MNILPEYAAATAGTSRDEIVITTGTEVGAMLCDGLGDGVMVECPTEDLEFLRNMSFGLLQGSRMRNTKTEYVSCPSCGRTLFDLQEVTDQIRTRTGHLPGVSIAVMGYVAVDIAPQKYRIFATALHLFRIPAI